MSEFLSNVLGEVKKLEFIAYEDSKFEKPTGDKFVVQYNPSEFKTSYAIAREDSGKDGTAETKKFKAVKQPDLNLEFIIDATGASPDTLIIKEKVDIIKKVNEFLKLCYEISSETHEPKYIMILYGNFSFKTIFKSCDIKYTLFRNDGTPLRAKFTAIFECNEDVKLLQKKWSLSSPDVTHKRIVKDSDTLTALAEKIYERNDLYQDVAAFNNLNSFRRVKTGKELFFPPLKK